MGPMDRLIVAAEELDAHVYGKPGTMERRSFISTPTAPCTMHCGKRSTVLASDPLLKRADPDSRAEDSNIPSGRSGKRTWGK